jgi:hypothetical protein
MTMLSLDGISAQQDVKNFTSYNFCTRVMLTGGSMLDGCSYMILSSLTEISDHRWQCRLEMIFLAHTIDVSAINSLTQVQPAHKYL